VNARVLPLVLLPLSSLPFAASLGGCAAARADEPTRAAADRAAVEAVLRGYETAYNAGDAGALAALHATDGGYYVPDGEPVVGRAALQAHWARSGGRGLSLELERHAASGDVGWAVGRWRIGDDARGPRGRFVLGLRRGAGGAFEIVVDLNNEARR
jgi:ketosteroid isomerase-like protein